MRRIRYWLWWICSDWHDIVTEEIKRMEAPTGTIRERLNSLNYAVERGLCNGVKNMIVDMDCLAALFDVRDVSAVKLAEMNGLKAERDEFRTCCELALKSLEDATGFTNGVRADNGAEEAEHFAAVIRDRIRNALEGTS